MRLLFPLLYIFCIVSYFLIGQIMVPGLPINLNILSILLLFVSCITIEKPKVDKWMIIYLFFLLFYALSSVATGYAGVFFHRLYSMFFMAFVIYLATSILIRYYGTLAPLLYPILIIGVLDAIVTVMQANGIPIRNPFLMMLIENTDQDDLLAAQNYELGRAISGLYYNAVFNGHYLLFFFLVSLLPQYKGLKIWLLFFSITIFIGILFCQQRSAFLFSSLAFIYILFKSITTRSKSRVFVYLIIIISVLYAANYVSNFIMESGSRLSEMSDTGRSETWGESLNFISENILIGGYDAFHKASGTYSHNLIFSAFIAGGLFGGFVLIALVFMQLRFILRKIRDSKIPLYSIVGIMYFCMLFDSMFHNTGLVEMDFSTFIVWAMFSAIMQNNLCPRLTFSGNKQFRIKQKLERI